MYTYTAYDAICDAEPIEFLIIMPWAPLQRPKKPFLLYILDKAYSAPGCPCWVPTAIFLDEYDINCVLINCKGLPTNPPHIPAIDPKKRLFINLVFFFSSRNRP